jgi:hypothetical protein
MHVFIISTFRYLAINHIFSQNRVHSNKMVFHVSCKHACFDILNICIMRKITITSIHVSFTHLYCMTPPTNLLEAPQPRNLKKKT